MSSKRSHRAELRPHDLAEGKGLEPSYRCRHPCSRRDPYHSGQPSIWRRTRDSNPQAACTTTSLANWRFHQFSQSSIIRRCARPELRGLRVSTQFFRAMSFRSENCGSDSFPSDATSPEHCGPALSATQPPIRVAADGVGFEPTRKLLLPTGRWWAGLDSNQQCFQCHGFTVRCLQTVRRTDPRCFGSSGRARTYSHPVNSRALYH